MHCSLADKFIHLITLFVHLSLCLFCLANTMLMQQSKHKQYVLSYICIPIAKFLGVLKRAACCRPRKRQPSTSTSWKRQAAILNWLTSTVDVDVYGQHGQNKKYVFLNSKVMKFFLFFKTLSFWGTFGTTGLKKAGWRWTLEKGRIFKKVH